MGSLRARNLRLANQEDEMSIAGRRNGLAPRIGAIMLAILVARGGLTGTAHAQAVGASLSGLITDERGGPVPGATVNIKNLGTGIVREVSANKGNRGFGNQLSDAGHRANENSYRVNGISINDYSNGAPGGATGLNLGVDGVQEFSVLTSNYTAEYGHTSGAVINAITKSGVNDFHGTGFFFDRDKIFDAKNFFDPAGLPIPPFRR